MKRITIKEASRMLGIGEQGCRMLIQLGKIPGAICYGPKTHRTYILTDEQIKNLMKGDSRDEG